MPDQEKFKSSVEDVSIETEMQKSYLDYAMSVIVSRALPDCRDGMKPVHRRILYSMYESGNHHDKPYRKSARIVGEVMGKYHPHGDNPVYTSLVRMAQEFSLREVLVDGQGNFGSIDGDSPAQMRYTEARSSKLAGKILEDINFETVDFQDNYDGSEKEPIVLPSRFPNLLVNGGSGIAVGMATSIPTHNLGEVINACVAYIDNQSISMEEILEFVPAPDFPTGGQIIGATKAKSALASGRGSVTMRAKSEIETIDKHVSIVITEIPYQVNKADLVKSIEVLSKNKVIDGISEVRDESNKLGMRVVVDIKKDFNPEIILNHLYKHTQLQTNFPVNMLALKNKVPQVMNIFDVIKVFIDFRKEVVTRRTTFLLGKANERAHLLIGLAIAVSNIDEVVRLIKSSKDQREARIALITREWEVHDIASILSLIPDAYAALTGSKIKLSESQAKSILEMRLHRLTGLEREKIENELKELVEKIAQYLAILGSEERLYALIKDELLEVKHLFATPRKTEILESEIDYDDEDFIQKEDIIIIITQDGYIKRMNLSFYKSQKRGGRGKSAISTNENDIISDLIVADTHSSVLFFSNFGKVYKVKAYKLPVGSAVSKGRAMVNLLPLDNGEKITSTMLYVQDESSYIVFATEKGNGRRNLLSDFDNIPPRGKIAIKLDEDDKLIGVISSNDDKHLFMSTKYGRAIRFSISDIRVFKSRTSDGVRAIKLAMPDDKVIGLTVLNNMVSSQEDRENYLKIPIELRDKLRIPGEATITLIEKIAQHSSIAESIASEMAKSEEFILTISSNGFGKCTSSFEYRTTNRGGIGITNMNISKNSYVVSSFPVKFSDEIIVITDQGTLIRTTVSSIRISSRNTKGVKIINLKSGENVVSVTKIVDCDIGVEDLDFVMES